jgi:hypothetical protein
MQDGVRGNAHEYRHLLKHGEMLPSAFNVSFQVLSGQLAGD